MDALTHRLRYGRDDGARDEAADEIESLRQQLTAAKETDLLLRNLLCVIHRDGGHHITAHGLDQSVQDAMEVFYNLRDLPEQLTAALAACETKDARLSLLARRCQPMVMSVFEVQDIANEALAIQPDAAALHQHDEATIRRCAAYAKEALNQKGPFTCNVPEEILSLIKEL